MKPKGMLIDCGGTLLEEASHDLPAGDAWMLSMAACNPAKTHLGEILKRRALIEKEVVVRRDQCQLETPWTVISKLIYDYYNIQFEPDWETLELGFWKAAVTTSAMPGAAEALNTLRYHDTAIGVLSNSMYRPGVLWYELKKQGLAEHLQFVMSSAEHGLRKPDPLLFGVAAAKLGRQAADIWFVGDKLEIDVKGARAAGMTSVWFKPTASAPLPCMGAASWSDLIRLYREA
jgi:putative hydrolase of the HAD superfamily